MISAAVVGGTGYTGKYILKFLNDHPFIKHIDIYANNSAGKNISNIFPEFEGELSDVNVKNIIDLDAGHDIYFIALPHGESLKFIPTLLNANKKVIDLGADYRLDDPEIFFSTYNLYHTSPELLKSKIYGLTEIAEDYESTNLIANPGCYPTAALLSSIPLLRNLSAHINNISTVSYSGISGAGKKASVDLLFAENYNSVKAYNVGNHRHEVEISQELKKYDSSVDYSLTTHLLPLFSGIYSTTIFHLNQCISQTDIEDIFTKEYSEDIFIRLRKVPPELKWVIGTNYCDINAKCTNNKVIVTTAIDNLIKGASGQAVQNMNKLFGWEEYLGIKSKKEEYQNV